MVVSFFCQQKLLEWYTHDALEVRILRRQDLQYIPTVPSVPSRRPDKIYLSMRSVNVEVFSGICRTRSDADVVCVAVAGDPSFGQLIFNTGFGPLAQRATSVIVPFTLPKKCKRNKQFHGRVYRKIYQQKATLKPHTNNYCIFQGYIDGGAAGGKAPEHKAFIM